MTTGCPACKDKPCKREWCPWTKGKKMEKDKKKATASIGSHRGIFPYDPSDPVEEKQAWMAAFDMTPERYDEVKELGRKRTEAFNTKYPYLKNLNWTNGEMYYTDDAGNRLETEIALDQATDSMKEAMANILKNKAILTETKIEKSDCSINDDQYLKKINPELFED